MKMARIQKQEQDGKWIDIDMMKLQPGDVFRKLPPDEDPLSDEETASIWVCDAPPTMTPDGPSCECHQRVAVRCPWCQGITVRSVPTNDSKTSFALECSGCGARGPRGSTLEEANYLWGERQRLVFQLTELLNECIQSLRGEAQEIADFTNVIGARVAGVLQPRARTRDMLARFNEMAANGPVEIAINCGYPGVEIPKIGVLDPNNGLTKLNFSPRFPGRELMADDNGLQQVLSFGTQEHMCKVPWRAVIAMRPAGPAGPAGPDGPTKPRFEVVPK